MLHRLMYITQGESIEAHFENANAFIAEGGLFVQLRWKSELTAELKTKIENWLSNLPQEVVVIINDYADLLNDFPFSGAHLGLEDAGLGKVKKAFPNKIIGGTTNTWEDVKLRISERSDYIGLGPFRFTATKAKLSPILGLEGYKEIIDKMNAQNIELPIYAIGGIQVEDVKALRNVGVYGVAVSGVITKSDNKKEIIKKFNEALYG